MDEAEVRDKLRVLVRDHTHYKQWETAYMNAMKIKADGEQQKRPTEYKMSEEYRTQVEMWLEQCRSVLTAAEKAIAAAVHELPIWTEVFEIIKGIGELTIGYLEAFVDLDKATEKGLVEVGKVHTFCGYGNSEDKNCPHGQKRKYCKSLKTQLYTLGMSLEKTRNRIGHKYGVVYDNRKMRTENSERLVKERQKGGKVTMVKWKEAKPCHRRDDALRVMIKEFLKDYVLERAALEGRQVRPPYAEEWLEPA